MHTTVAATSASVREQMEILLEHITYTAMVFLTPVTNSRGAAGKWLPLWPLVDWKTARSSTVTIHDSCPEEGYGVREELPRLLCGRGWALR